MSLKGLDDRLLPEIGRRVDAVLKKLPSPPEPSGPAPFIVRLRRLDDRWGRGPLALLREVPQVAALVVGLLIFANGLALRVRLSHRAEARNAEASPTPGSGEPTPEDVVHHLGPQIGDSVTQYLATTNEKLGRIAASQPDGAAVAVISFRSYLTPEAVRDLVGPMQVRRVFFRAPLPLPLTTPHAATVEDVVRDSRKEFLRVAATRAAAARELRKVAATIENDPAQKNDMEKDAAAFEHEATVLRGRCACVYAVVVRTRLRLLLDVSHVSGVRAVDSSPAGGVLDDYDFSALLPEEKVTVTGGNQSG